eukprot:TRINITY_DN2476_c0_g1_i1.p1 TRINITY_DN2476_c0_g1~~TRINITY_DN2476_c0_g1_i1.p1  ORF type:complete len:165 (+),score=23.83 TRINITY_DN2476_c0_g1_i1:332-826(+)
MSVEEKDIRQGDAVEKINSETILLMALALNAVSVAIRLNGAEKMEDEGNAEEVHHHHHHPILLEKEKGPILDHMIGHHLATIEGTLFAMNVAVKAIFQEIVIFEIAKTLQLLLMGLVLNVVNMDTLLNGVVIMEDEKEKRRSHNQSSSSSSSDSRKKKEDGVRT